ncbi:MAG: phosphatase PAP2 family protein [Candidatus Nanohaloarchaea archaeon]
MPSMEALTRWVTGVYGTPLDTLMVLSAEYAVFLSFVVLAYMWFSGERDAVALAMYTGVAGVLMSYAMGLLYSHPGPYTVLDTLLSDPAGENTFPSQHTALAFSLAFAVLKRRPGYGYALAVFAVLTGLGRFYTGLHWPLDIFGALLASGIAYLLVNLLEKPLMEFSRPFIELYEKYSPV